MGLIWHLGHFLAWLIVLVFLLAIFWIKQKHFMYSDKRFQIRIFIYSDIYCSQASRRYPWRVHYKNQDKLADSYEGVRTPRSVLQINIEDVRTSEQHRADARSISIQQGVCFQKLTLFGKSLQSVRTTMQHVRTMSSICRPSGRLGNTSRRYPIVQIILDFRSNVERILAKTVWTLGQAVWTQSW
jgi:hypothetical protein